MTAPRATARRFTGRHMWLVMLGFFGTVVAVNFGMAWVAAGSFGGTVVDNSYVASQKYNGWLKAARDQQALGWTATMSLDADRRPVLVLSDAAPGTATRTATATAIGTAHHPLGRAPDMALAFTAVDGRLVAARTLPPGRWLVRVAVTRGTAVVRLAETLE